MLPILFRWGESALFSYHFLLSLACLVGVFIWVREAKKKKLASEKIFELSFYALLGAFLGARILYILSQWEIFLNDPQRIWRLWEGGLVFYGGFLGLIFTIFFTCKRMKLPRAAVFNSLAPALAISHAIGRLGCFLNGCCFGRSCDLPWAVEYSHPLSAAPKNTPLHPTQVYEIIGLILIFLLLTYRKKWKLIQIHLENFPLYLLSYGILRLITEAFRGDLARGQWGPLSPSQWIAISMICMSLFLDFKARKEHNYAHENRS